MMSLVLKSISGPLDASEGLPWKERQILPSLALPIPTLDGAFSLQKLE